MIDDTIRTDAIERIYNNITNKLTSASEEDDLISTFLKLNELKAAVIKRDFERITHLFFWFKSQAKNRNGFYQDIYGEINELVGLAYGSSGQTTLNFTEG